MVFAVLVCVVSFVMRVTLFSKLASFSKQTLFAPLISANLKLFSEFYANESCSRVAEIMYQTEEPLWLLIRHLARL